MEDIRLIEIKEAILSENKHLADEIRHCLTRDKTFMLNLMSSPGSGKTSLILRTIEKLKGEFRIAVIEADIDSMVDAEKVAARGVRAVQLRTGGFCHVDARMVEKGLKPLDVKELDLVIIENVGNLVCPAGSDTGAHKNAMILSVPEGDDKPLKYPRMFQVSDALVVNKIDYLHAADFSVQAVKQQAMFLNPDVVVFETCCRTGEGIDSWSHWLETQLLDFLAC